MNRFIFRWPLIAGLLLLALSRATNKRCICWIFGCDVGGFESGTLANVHIIRYLLIMAGTAFCVPIEWWRWIFRSAAMRWLKPRLDRRTIVALLPIAAASVGFQIMGCAYEHLSLWSPVVLSSVIESATLSCLVILLIGNVVMRIFGWPLLLLIVVAAWAIAFPIETLIVFYGGGRFESDILGAANTDSFEVYSSAGSISVLSAGIILVLGGGILLARRIAHPPPWSSIVRIAVWLGLIALLQPSYLIFRALGLPLSYLQRSKITSERQLVRYYAPDPVIRAVKLLCFPQEFRSTSDVSTYRDVIDQLHLPFGKPPAPDLGLAPFRRVVFITSESLSLPLISRYNLALPGELTPVLDSLPKSNLRYRTCSMPTTPGLATHYCSHPNYRLITERRYPNSFVEILKQDGWRTVLFDSSSGDFDCDERRLAEIGYGEQYHREWQMQFAERRPYIHSWGLCDRLTLSSAADYLREHRSERVFLSVLTIDTHGPEGRTDYGDLVYPPDPEWIARFPGSTSLLRSVFRFDYDLGLFLTKMRENELLDQDCLVIITADHCMPAGPRYLAIPGTSDSPFERIPFIVLSGRPLPKFDPEREASQASTAPTIFQLLGIPALAGWWGRGLYDSTQPPPTFVASDRRSGNLQIGTPTAPVDELSSEAVRTFFNTLVRTSTRSPFRRASGHSLSGVQMAK